MTAYGFGLMQIIQNCIIDRSDNVHDGMNHVTETIIEEAIMTIDPDIIGI
jgi:hypothetical protein